MGMAKLSNYRQYLKDKNLKTLRCTVLLVLLTFNWAGTQHLPNIKLKDLQNKRQDLSQYYTDGPILLNFWNLACEPCKKEMKELDKLNIKYRDQGFEYISINIDTPRSMSKVKSYINSQKFSFTVLSDPKAELFRKMGGKVMPFVIIADSTGAIIKRHMGYNPGDEKELEKEILHLLADQQPVKDTLQIEPEASIPQKPLENPTEESTTK
jgi:peroxiredoxin